MGLKLLCSPAAALHQGTSSSMAAHTSEPPDKLFIHPIAILSGNKPLSALHGSSPRGKRGSAADVAHGCSTVWTTQPARLPSHEETHRSSPEVRPMLFTQMWVCR